MLRTVGRSLPALALLIFCPALAVAEQKVGFVDGQRALTSSSEGQSASKQLNQIVERKKSQLQPKQDQLEKKKTELESQQYVLSKEALEERKIELLKLQRDLEREMSAAEEEITLENRRVLAPMMKNIESAVATVGREGGFTLILEKSALGLLYYDPSLDVTDQVIQKLNANGKKN